MKDSNQNKSIAKYELIPTLDGALPEPTGKTFFVESDSTKNVDQKTFVEYKLPKNSNFGNFIIKDYFASSILNPMTPVEKTKVSNNNNALNQYEAFKNTPFPYECREYKFITKYNPSLNLEPGNIYIGKEKKEEGLIYSLITPQGEEVREQPLYPYYLDSKFERDVREVEKINFLAQIYMNGHIEGLFPLKNLTSGICFRGDSRGIKKIGEAGGFFSTFAGRVNCSGSEGCDLHLLPQLPNDLTKYIGGYIFCNSKDSKKLYYIRRYPPHAPFEVTISDFSKFEKDLNSITTQSSDSWHLSDYQAVKLITSNGGWTPFDDLHKHQSLETRKNEKILNINNHYDNQTGAFISTSRLPGVARKFLQNDDHDDEGYYYLYALKVHAGCQRYKRSRDHSGEDEVTAVDGIDFTNIIGISRWKKGGEDSPEIYFTQHYANKMSDDEKKAIFSYLSFHTPDINDLKNQFDEEQIKQLAKEFKCSPDELRAYKAFDSNSAYNHSVDLGNSNLRFKTSSKNTLMWAIKCNDAVTIKRILKNFPELLMEKLTVASNYANEFFNSRKLHEMKTIEILINDSNNFADILSEIYGEKWFDQIENDYSFNVIYKVLGSIPEKYRFDFANKHQNKIEGIDSVVFVLSKLPINLRPKFAEKKPNSVKNGLDLSRILYLFPEDTEDTCHRHHFAKAHEGKIEDGDELAVVLGTLSENSRPKFAIENQDKIKNGKQLIAVLEQLKKDYSRYDLAIQNKHKIEYVQGICSVLDTLPEETQYKFAKENKDKLKSALNVSFVLVKLPKNDKYPFALENKDKIKNDKDFNYVCNTLPVEKQGEFKKEMSSILSENQNDSTLKSFSF